MRDREFKRQLDRLEAGIAAREAATAARAAPPAFDVAALRRAGRAAGEEVDRLLGGAPGADAVAAHLAQHATTSEQLTGPMSKLFPAVPAVSESSRWTPAATVLLFRRLPADLRPLAATPAALSDYYRGRRWAGEWIDALAAATSRLPPETDPAVLRRLVGLFAGATSDLATCPQVCAACGLRRPLLPEDRSHYAECPHCGEAEVVRASGCDPAAFPWREAARRDLESVMTRGED